MLNVLRGGAVAIFSLFLAAGVMGAVAFAQVAPITGTVASVSGTTLTVVASDSTSYTVDASGATVTKNGLSASVSDTAIGDTVSVEGTVIGTSITATSITDGAALIPLSSDATLSSMTVSVGTLSPAFDPTITSYTLTLPTYQIGLTPVTATANDPNATVTYQGTTGYFNHENITVTAQDGTQQVYTINFTYVVAVTNVTSASGSSAGGDVVLITGTDLSGATAVDFALPPRQFSLTMRRVSLRALPQEPQERST